jgi:two-component system, NarL family, sensor histidine kinase UhpB
VRLGRPPSSKAEADRHSLPERLNRIQEQERGRLATDLHDHLGALLAVLHSHLERATERLGAVPGGAVAENDRRDAVYELAEATQIAEHLVAAMREIQISLRPESLDEHGLATAIQALQGMFGRAGLDIELALHGIEGRRFGTDLETTAFRIAQHALTNVLRHSGVDRATVQVEIVSLGKKQFVRVSVEDAGKGFATTAVGAASGLTGMRDRASVVNGTLTVDSAPGRGTRIRADLPIGPDKSAAARRPGEK